MIDFSKIKTYPINERSHKVSIDKDFARLDSGIDMLDNPEIKEIAEEIVSVKQKDKENKRVILMMGAHVIKVGMSPYIMDLMKKGFVDHIATNGAGAIHDFEIALIGQTSEDVGNYLDDGKFGMVEETGKALNISIKENQEDGFGKIVGRMIDDNDLAYKEYSIFYWAYKLNIPITVHVAIGTDTIHQHPLCDGAALGRASYQDFKIFTESVSRLDSGVILNFGSAVILPEVFLKALTIARNLGYNVGGFTAANFDMIKHYRPTVNVVQRPTQKGGKGIYVVEKHERTIPTLYNLIIKRCENE